MPYAEIPSDDAVVDALKKLGGRATARELCEKLVKTNRPAEIANWQSSGLSERGRISVGHDWNADRRCRGCGCLTHSALDIGHPPKRGDIERTSGDQRSEFERDRDRLLYSSCVSSISRDHANCFAPVKRNVFHTRQQHTIKVAQVGRRLANCCKKEQPEEAEFRGLDPEVVEAAVSLMILGTRRLATSGSTRSTNLSSKNDDDGFGRQRSVVSYHDQASRPLCRRRRT
ncbi:hypothetical protein [Sinorhizobium americanum]|uniref:hypothetical protein n=1 Tax=Sinorhizobium americanum TaxID=194963 RepID=UPI0012EC9F82|nr:hypothetical protein [Sinorhizobium americanum]